MARSAETISSGFTMLRLRLSPMKRCDGCFPSPLYAVIGKGGFRWGDDQQDAFDELLRSMNNPPVLAIPNSQGHIGSCRRRGIKSSPERKRENNRLWQRSAISRTTAVLYHQERVTGGDQIYSPIPPLPAGQGIHSKDRINKAWFG